MRDPNRIDPFLEELRELWRLVPDWRFGQLMMNVTRDEWGVFRDSWNWEDEAWLQAIAVWKQRLEGGGDEPQEGDGTASDQPAT